MADETSPDPVELATEITIAWLNNANNRAVADDVPGFLRTMHTTLIDLANGGTSATSSEVVAQEHVPAVSVRRSLASKDHILSLIDGKPYKTLTRHLATHGLTPDEYRRRYHLRHDYPMVAVSYAEHRRELAKRIGLGRRPAAKAAPATAAPAVSSEPKAAPAVKAAPAAKAAAPAKKAPAKPKAEPKPRATKVKAPAPTGSAE